MPGPYELTGRQCEDLARLLSLAADQLRSEDFVIVPGQLRDWAFRLLFEDSEAACAAGECECPPCTTCTPACIRHHSDCLIGTLEQLAQS